MAKLFVFICLNLLAVSMAGRGRCPSRCTCFESYKSYTVTCTDLFLKRLPRNLPSKTTALNFSGNQLLELDNRVFRGLKELRMLRISRNVISYVDKDAFSGLSKLEEIDLRGNVITALAPETFRSQNRLKSINLAYNKISNLDSISKSFVHLPSLESLTLTGNQIRTLPANAFQKTKKLQELYLSHNPLRSVSDQAFVEQGEHRVLNKLVMSYTELTDFPSSALADITIRQLDISHGQIRHIDQAALNVVRRMDSRDLIWEGNPLKCDCKSVQLWLHVRAFGSNHSPITCASPHEVAGMDIYYVQKDSLVCGMSDSPRFVRQPVSTSIHIGGAVVLVCQADGNPDPGISWLKNNEPLPTNHCGMKYYKTCTGSLVIYDVNANDVGEYVCIIKDKAHPIALKSKPATLTIVQPCNGTVVHDYQANRNDDNDEQESVQTSGSGSDDDSEDDYETDVELLSRISDGNICSDPGIPANGHRYVDKKDGQENAPFPVDTVINYGCNSYYEIEGESSLQCRSNKTWSHPLPQCKPACGQKDVTDTQYLTRQRRAMPHSTEASGAIETAPRIIDGEVSLKGEWPWLGLLTIYFQSCGVSLVNRNWAVTAAHCVVEGRNRVKSKSLMRVYFGKHQFVQQEHGQQGRGVHRILVHPQYGVTNTFDYDVALLELEAPVDINKVVRPVCLPPLSSSYVGDYDKVGMRAVVTGWGKTNNDPDARVARQLHKGVVEIASHDDCKGVMGNVTDRMVCAGKYSDTCQGDSGGPLVTVHQNRWYLSGITSWGPKVCGNSKYYGVYTRVTNSEILNWIYLNINTLV